MGQIYREFADRDCNSGVELSASLEEDHPGAVALNTRLDPYCINTLDSLLPPSSGWAFAFVTFYLALCLKLLDIGIHNKRLSFCVLSGSYAGSCHNGKKPVSALTYAEHMCDTKLLILQRHLIIIININIIIIIIVVVVVVVVVIIAIAPLPIGFCCKRGSFRKGHNSMENGRMDESNSQRKRIAVACGRCRQRKIRCSGDNGSGDGCTNCKNAGFEPCQFLRVSSQEVQGVRSTGLNYNVSVSRKYSSRNSAASPILTSPSLYSQNMMSSVGQTGLGEQSDMTYGCGTKQYHQVHEWSNGYGGEQPMDYETNHQAAATNDHQYMMGSYRPTSNPMVVRNNSMVYMDVCGGYSYGNTSGRQAAAAGDGGYSFNSTIPCYSESTTDDGERIIPLSSSRSRPCSVSAIGRRASAAPNVTDHASGLVDIHGSNSYGYDTGSLASFHPGSMDRGADMYTTAPQADEFGQGTSLRSSLTGYPYRYTDTTQEGGDVTAMQGQQYLAQGRASFLGAMQPAENDAVNSRGSSFAGLHG
ncbi:Zn(2)-C6 fungal-type DNA-binding domain protein [Metarhizium rileyi]|uniref:Zn(2)-C6 fungal-type DNA-binding domain protein n=1 Tax=Metarhizium rileyi (strain RCEF 4871) TaxID=1649241 RepID=A0A166WD80_METRR|nr:Zn(2)-C6 fungal-type DNA-binding domain protein [Metarhizium rileyi RCEF 4871]